MTVSQTYNGDIVWSGGAIDPGLAAQFVAGFSVDQDSWDYSTNADLDFLREGETITFSFNVVATDDSAAGNNASAPHVVTITITGTNDKPVAVADVNGSDVVTEAGINPGNTSFPGDPSATGNVLTNDTDVDTGDTKAVVGVAAGTSAVDVAGSVGSDVTGTYGKVQIAANGTWTYTLDNSDTDTQKLVQGQVVHDIFTYTMQDANGATSTTTLDITITGTNDKPVAVADVNGSDVVTDAGVNPGNTSFPGDPSATGNVLTAAVGQHDAEQSRADGDADAVQRLSDLEPHAAGGEPGSGGARAVAGERAGGAAVCGDGLHEFFCAMRRSWICSGATSRSCRSNCGRRATASMSGR